MIIEKNGGLFLEDNFPNTMCRKLREEAKKSFNIKFPGRTIIDLTTSDGYGYDSDILDAWSDEVRGSEDDAYNHEIGSKHLPKRKVKPEFFQQGWLEKVLDLGPVPAHEVVTETQQSQSGSQDGVTPPPLYPPPFQVWVALNGHPAGPFDPLQLQHLLTLGQLRGDTLFWLQGMKNWTLASMVGALAPILNQRTGSPRQ
jgi:hypothetical protein